MRQSRERSDTVMRRDSRVSGVVSTHSDHYVRTYRPIVVNHYGRCNGYYSRWDGYYRPWYRYGFYGGFYFRLYPVYDIHVYYYNPIIFWLWADAWDDYYYSRWYGSDWWSYPDLRLHFPRPGMYYPTEALRDLAMGISLMPPREQGNFRIGLINASNRLEAILSERMNQTVYLGRNDIVVTHYQMLESAVVLDGFVSAEAQQFPFKIFLDLEDPNNNSVFVPALGEGEPTEAQLYELRLMNERIEALGGTNEYPSQGE